MSEVTQPIAFIAVSGPQGPGPRLAIEGPRFIVGKDPAANLCLRDDITVSRQHLEIRIEGDKLVIEDLNSRNGTYVNGKRIKEPTVLTPPAVVMAGRSRLAILCDESVHDATVIINSHYSTQGSILVPPSEFFKERKEAFLVVDVVKSTQLISTGETLFLKVVSVLGKVLERSMRAESEGFLKCTGDGFFATFGSATAALDCVIAIAENLPRYFDNPVKYSAALHWGESRQASNGDRLGQDVHAVFSVEDLRHKVPKLIEMVDTMASPCIAVMSAAFRNEIVDERKDRAKFLGAFPLKGLSEDMDIFHMIIRSKR